MSVVSLLRIFLLVPLLAVADEKAISGYLYQLANPGLLQNQRTVLIEALNGVPNWQEVLGKQMAESAVTARGVRKEDLSEEEIARTVDLSKIHGPPQAVARSGRDDAAAKMNGQAGNARIRLAAILSGIEGMRNEDSVRLIAPLLSENGLNLRGSPPNLSAQLRATEMLGALVDHGVIPESIAPDQRNRYYQPEAWRTWWAQNKNRYSSVPAALAELEEANHRAEVIAPPSSPGGRSPRGSIRDSHTAHDKLPGKDSSDSRPR